MKYTMDAIKNAYESPIHKVDRTYNLYRWIAPKMTLWIANYLPWLSPNLVTFISFFIYVVALYCFLQQWFLTGVIVLYFRNVLDDVDGILARMTNRKSKLGAVLDNFVGGGMFIPITYAVLLYVNIPIITLFLLPFFILMGFQHLLQQIIVGYVLKGEVPRKQAGYMELMQFQEIRLFAFHILPLFPYVININIVTLPMLLVTLTILVVLKQFFWLIHHKDDFKGIWIRSHLPIKND